MTRTWLDELRDLLDEVGEGAIEFEAGGAVGPLVDGDRPAPGDDRPSGREKFAARRKRKRLARLLDRARREGIDVEDLADDRRSAPLVRSTTLEDGALVEVVVDRPGADLRPTDDPTTVLVAVDDHEAPVDLPFAPGSVETTVTAGATTFELRP